MSDVQQLAGVRGSGSPELERLALAVVQPGFEGLQAPDWLRSRLEAGLGGVALFARNVDNPEQVARLTAQLHESNPDALVAVDEEGGDVTRLEHRTGSSWPGNLALGSVDDTALTERVAHEIGTLLDSVGIDLDYAPDADVNVEAANPVIGVRSFGSDPALVARHTAAWVAGLQSAGVLACAKHFPGHGDTTVDSHLGIPTVTLAEPAAASPALEPFRAAIDVQAAAVMSAHVRLAGRTDRRPATLLPEVMTGLLRDELGFTGLALSDGLEMGAIAGPHGLADGAVQALAAGVDALCIGGGLSGPDTVDLVVDAVVDAVREGRLAVERLVEAADRVAAAARLRAALSRSTREARVTTSAGLDAARRALTVHGAPPRTDRAPAILLLTAPSNIAVGDQTPIGVVTAARGRWSDVVVARYGPCDDLSEVLARTAGRPLWVVLRDPHRHRWMPHALATVCASRPDAVVVETGWPGWEAPAGVPHLVTRGASWASGTAVVERLTRG